MAKNRNNHIGTSSSHSRHSSRTHSHPPYINGISENEVFPGFHPAMEACFLEWDDYQIPGVTYTKDLNPLYHSPFTIFRHDKQNDSVHQVGTIIYLILQEYRWWPAFGERCVWYVVFMHVNKVLDYVFLSTIVLFPHDYFTYIFDSAFVTTFTSLHSHVLS